jgi:hypothetical protein
MQIFSVVIRAIHYAKTRAPCDVPHAAGSTRLPRGMLAVRHAACDLPGINRYMYTLLHLTCSQPRKHHAL